MKANGRLNHHHIVWVGEPVLPTPQEVAEGPTPARPARVEEEERQRYPVHHHVGVLDHRWAVWSRSRSHGRRSMATPIWKISRAMMHTVGGAMFETRSPGTPTIEPGYSPL